jgi:hypothetical protein
MTTRSDIKKGQGFALYEGSNVTYVRGDYCPEHGEYKFHLSDDLSENRAASGSMSVVAI